MSKASHPFLWKAMQVSVGRLGIITAVTFKIVPNALMTRTKYDVTVDSFLADMKALQDGYNAQGEASPAVQAMDGTMYCWFVTRRRPSTSALWKSRVVWASGAAPAVTPATTPGALYSPDSLTDAQLAAALSGGAEPPITRQPLWHTQRGAPLTFSDLGIGFPRTYGDGTSLTMSPLFTNGALREAAFLAAAAALTWGPRLPLQAPSPRAWRSSPSRPPCTRCRPMACSTIRHAATRVRLPCHQQQCIDAR